MREYTICRDCIYIIKPASAGYYSQPCPEAFCGAEELLKINFVTGQLLHPRCRVINIKGECEWFKKV